MRRVLPLLVFTLAISAARADALTIRDIIELSRAGLGEDVLLALIEVDRRVFPVDPDTIKQLKESGVPERVIVAVVRSGRTPPIEPAPARTEPRSTVEEPQVIVIDHGNPPPAMIVREVAVPVVVSVPVYVPVTRARRSHPPGADTSPYRTGMIPHAPIGLPHAPMGLSPEPRKGPEPASWRWGGRLRPGVWKPN
jgi:hypothetical protein